MSLQQIEEAIEKIADGAAMARKALGSAKLIKPDTQLSKGLITQGEHRSKIKTMLSSARLQRDSKAGKLAPLGSGHKAYPGVYEAPIKYEHDVSRPGFLKVIK